MGKALGFCRWAILSVVLIWMLASVGCTRNFFRKQVDREVDSVLREKDVSPEIKIENMHVYPDMRARFADPYNPDRPPMPPDDPLAWKLGPNPQKPGHAGIGNFQGTGYLDLLAQWDAENRASRALQTQVAAVEKAPDVRDAVRTVANWQPDVEQIGPPAFAAPMPAFAAPMSAKPKPYLLNVEQAMELGLINSREFQARREDLFLSALPVTRERFSFSAQYLAAAQAIRERTGLVNSPNTGNNWQFGSTVGVSKLFSTGGLLLLAFANDTVINFGNPSLQRVTSSSTIHLDVIQPFLRGGGKAVALEPLTLAERSLLYEVRAYARFRKQYYQFLIGGGDLTPAPGSVTNPGSLASSHPLLGTAAGSNPARQQVVPSGLGAVGGAAVPGTLFLNINTTSTSEGYMPALYKYSELRYENANVKALSDVLPLFEEYERGGLVSFLQVGQVQLQLLQSRSTVLVKEQIYQNALDTFKSQLGLPIHTPLELDDQPIRPVTGQLARYDSIIEDYKATLKQLDRLDDEEQPEKIRAGLDSLAKNGRLTKSAPQFQETFSRRWDVWQSLKDAKSFNDYAVKQKARQRKLLELKTDRELKGQTLTMDEQKELRALDSDIATGKLEEYVRAYEKAPWRKETREDARLKEKSGRWRDVRNAFTLVLGDASEERFNNQRTQWSMVTPAMVNGVDLARSDLECAYNIVTETALENRLDLMNARGQLVDSWRQVRVFANGLLGVFNMQYHMDSSTPPDQATPLAFQKSRTRHQMIMNFEVPMVRMTERNAYRASLIAYQRSRRDLQQKEDEITAQVRLDVRQLQVLAENLTIQQQAVELAYKQVESAYEIFTAPQVPDNSANAAANAAGNAASLTNQLLQAYARLPQAQEQLVKTWIDYQIARQQLFLDLELMPLDARGVWIDELANNAPGPRNVPQHERRPDDIELPERPPARLPTGRAP